MLLTGGSAWAEDVTTISVGSSSLTWTADEDDYTATSGDFTLRYEKGTYSNSISGGIQSAELRLYSGTNFVISSTNTITKIVYTVADGSGKNYSVGNLSTTDGNLQNGIWTGSATSVSASLSAQNRIKSVTITYTASGGGSSSLENSDFALTGSTDLSFDLNGNADAQKIYYSTSSTGAVTVSASEYVTTSVDEDEYSITVTPLKKTNGAQTITVSQAADDTYAAGTATFTVTIDDTTPKTGGWVKTNITDLAEGDVFVIVGDNGKTYAMSNDNGAGNAPTAVAVTIEDDEITGDVAENIQWNISYNSADNTYTLYPNGSTETWLYCTSSNNGVRVGTNENKSFRIKDNYLFNVETSTYLGIYSSQDWRRYTSINSNITGQAFAFYKYVDNAVAVKKPTITVEETFIGSTTATITCGTEDATIYYSYDNATWTEYTEALTITETTTIYAKAVKDNDESAIAQKTTTKTLATPTVTIDATGITNTNVYEGTAAGSLAATVTYNDAAVEGATVAWSGNNDEVATIDAATGAVTLVGAGSVTFTATFAGNADYNSATGTYELTVTNSDPNGPGTENNPYTVAQAKANTPSTGTSANVYIKGIVSAFFKTDIMSDGSNFRYYISDDGTTDNQLIVYKGKGLDNKTFTSANDLQIGDEVIICGGLTMYSNAPEVAANNYIVSLIRPVIPTVIVNPATVNAPFEGAEGSLSASYENITDFISFDYKFCDENGDELEGGDPNWIYVEINEEEGEYEVNYIIDANDGEARTAYFKVYTFDDELEEVYSIVTVTQAEYVAPEETIGNFVKVTSTNDITSGQYLIVYEEGSVALDGSRDDSDNNNLDAVSNTIGVTIENGSIAATTTNVKSVFNIDVTAGTLQSASGLYIGVSRNSNELKTSEDAEAYTHTFSINDDENAVIAAVFEGSTMTMKYNYASNQTRFRYYKSGQRDIQLYKFVADAEDVEVTLTAGYATYCSTSDLDFSAVEGLTAYKATITDTEARFTEVKQVPAGEGVLLKGAAGTYNVPVAANAAALTGNAFIGVTEQRTINETGIFVLMNGNKGVGFYKTSSAFTVGANTAYLPAFSAGARTFISLDGDNGTTTGIAEVEKMRNVENENVFNLSGQRVNKPTKGLYIVNGKKMAIK